MKGNGTQVHTMAPSDSVSIATVIQFLALPLVRMSMRRLNYPHNLMVFEFLSSKRFLVTQMGMFSLIRW